MKKNILFSIFTIVLLSFSIISQAGKVLDSDWDDVVYGKCSDQNTAWWSSAEAIRIAENVLLYQRDNGGWPKDTNMQNVLTQSEKDKLIADKPSTAGGYCTIDNGAVRYELEYLSRVYNALSDEVLKATLKTGFLKGIQYLLDIQFDNGGWPQFYPFRSSTSYSNHITYNDNAMINVMEILRHIYQKDSYYSIKAEEPTITAAKVAFDKGVDCILKTQYVQNGILTSWCAQHNYKTLEPVLARAYELPSLSGGESAGIINLLMSLDKPSYEIRRAIYYAANWYNNVRIKGQRLEGFTNSDGLSDKRIVMDPNAADMWARFYTLDNSTPFFCDRDGVMVFSIAEIGHERRNGYSWYGNYGVSVLNGYKTWFTKWGVIGEMETILRSPHTDDKYFTSDKITISANATEHTIGTIQKFELFLDSKLIHEYKSSTIDTFITTLPVGEHIIVVKSTDNKGNTASDTSSFTVVQAYQLTVTNGTGSGIYAEGDEIKIVGEYPKSGLKFAGWAGDTVYIADVNNRTTTVTIPASDISLTATYIDKSTSVSDIRNSKNFICYPNPAGESFSIDMGSINNSIVEIFNLSGQMVYSKKIGTGICIINHKLNNGLYLVQIKTNTNDISRQKIYINVSSM